ncbi:MAG: DUF5915 domain-containing protein, partial [Bacilli bacterium]
LNTTLSESLINEGIARDFVSKIQNLRKEHDFNVSDRITITYNGSKKVTDALKEFDEFIRNETLAVDIINDESLVLETDINGEIINLDITKM